MKAPFDGNGHLVHYPLPWRDDIEWREVEPFWTGLHLDGMRRGRSAAYFIWLDDAGRPWSMFMTDMVDLLKNGDITRGYALYRQWTIQKRGTNYGIRRYTG